MKWRTRGLAIAGSILLMVAGATNGRSQLTENERNPVVGDSPADIEAAHRAGVKSCAVTYGYGQHADLAKWQPDYWADSLSELLAKH